MEMEGRGKFKRLDQLWKKACGLGCSIEKVESCGLAV
jgi:hypothetical protein